MLYRSSKKKREERKTKREEALQNSLKKKTQSSEKKARIKRLYGRNDVTCQKKLYRRETQKRSRLVFEVEEKALAKKAERKNAYGSKLRF